MQGDESKKPTVPELLAASEAVLLTSLQEGFGLPYLEAAAARRPLMARELPNIAPDLAKFGFTFPQSYREVQVDPSLFDWRGERERQARLFAEWKSLMPRAASQLAGEPAVLAAGKSRAPCPSAVSPSPRNWRCWPSRSSSPGSGALPLNPFLKTWRERAVAGQLKTSPWPRSAARWLGGRAYARRFLALVPPLLAKAPRAGASQAAQAEFLRKKLRAENLYPLLWNSRT